MRAIGLDARLEATASAGRFGRTCFVWKSQLSRLEKRGITVELIKEVAKAHYLVHLSWAEPQPSTFSELLFHQAAENVLQIEVQNEEQLKKQIQQVANMISFSTVVTLPSIQDIGWYTDWITKNAFQNVPMPISNQPVYFVSWANPAMPGALASQLQKQVTQLAFSEYNV